MCGAACWQEIFINSISWLHYGEKQEDTLRLFFERLFLCSLNTRWVCLKLTAHRARVLFIFAQGLWAAAEKAQMALQVCSGCTICTPVTTSFLNHVGWSLGTTQVNGNFVFAIEGEMDFDQRSDTMLSSDIILLSYIIFQQYELLWISDRLNYYPLEFRNCFEKEK